MSDEMFAARHLRYEIYEKKQIQPLLNQRRRSRSNRSESEHSLTASANPRSPDMAGSVGSEAAVGESAFTGAGTEEAAPAVVQHSDATAIVYQLPEQAAALPTVDVRLCRMSTSTLEALTRTASLGTEPGHTDVRTPVVEVCEAGSWPVRSFPLVDDDYDKLLAAESSSNSCCESCTMPVSAAPIVSAVDQTEPSVSDSTVIPQSSVNDRVTVPVTTL